MGPTRVNLAMTYRVITGSLSMLILKCCTLSINFLAYHHPGQSITRDKESVLTWLRLRSHNWIPENTY